MPVCLITVYKLLFYQELIPCWCGVLSCFQTALLLRLEPSPALLPCFSRNVALLQLQALLLGLPLTSECVLLQCHALPGGGQVL